MKLQAILHIPKSSAYAYPLAPKKFHVRLRTAKDDVEQAWLVIGNQYLWKTRERFPMEKTGSDALFDYFEATYCCEDTRLGYYFEISSGEECLVYAESGFHNPHTVNIDGERTEFLHFQFPYIHAQEVHQPPEWVRSAAFYQIFPERFWNGDPALSPEGTEPWGTPPTPSNFMGGDLKGVVQKLDHLTELGANAIYLTPIFEATSNHKYDTIDYTRIDPHFGDESTLVELVQQAHRRGIRIMLDGVFNHCGFYFRQFQDVLRHGEASPYKDWFHIHSFPVTLDPPNFDGFGIGPGMPKLNTQNPEVKEYLLGAVAKWTRTGIDGWRLDVSDEVDSDFWRDFRRTVKGINPEAVIIGENWWDAEPWLRGDQFDGVMNYEVQRACVLYFAQRKIHPQELQERLTRAWMRNTDQANFSMLNLLDSHDTPRFLTECGGDINRLIAAAVFQYSYPGMPCTYYGTEIGMTGTMDPGCRAAFDWDQEHWDQPLFQMYQKLIRARLQSEALQKGTLRFCSQGEVFAMKRATETETVLTVINQTDAPQTYTLPWQGRGTDLLEGNVYESTGGSLSIPLAPGAAALVRLEPTA